MKFFYFYLLLGSFCQLLLAGSPEFSLFNDKLQIRVYSGTNEISPAGYKLNEHEWVSENGLKIKLEPKSESGIMLGKLVFSMPAETKTVALLTIEAVTVVNSPTSFFDGFEEHKWNGTKSLERNSIMQTFPLAASYDENSGCALGLSPDSIVSYMHNGIRQGGSGTELFFRTRVVVDAQRPQSISFCLMSFQPTFGWRDAVQEYYQQFPSYFRPAIGVDERIYGIGGYFVSTHVTRNLEIHSGRQLGLNWEWSYCPWNLAGNWYIEAEEWQPEDGYMHWDKYWQRRRCSYEEYHFAESQRFVSGNRQAAMFFYILVKDTAKELVHRYPDACRVKDNGQTVEDSYLFSLPDNKNKTILSFAYGSGLADYLERELRLVAENYQISGFALDMTNWSAYEYCQAQYHFAMGRSFDTDGKIYTADSVLPIPFAQYIHTLKKGDKTIAVMMNHALENQPALPVFYADAVMFEGTPENQIDNFRSLRLMSGQKPLTFWGSLGRGNVNAINWDLAQDPAIKGQIFSGLAQYLLFYCLRYGASPMNWAVAYQDGDFFAPWLEIIRDIKKEGWQVVPALSCQPQKELWFGRFGIGLDSIFTISNPGTETVDTTLLLHRRYLQNVNFRPKAMTGQKISPEVLSDVIRIPICLKPKEIMVLRDISWQAPQKATILASCDEILAFYDLASVQSGQIAVLMRNQENINVYDFLDRYYPYIQACLEKNGKGFTREPGMLNHAYNNCWPLALQTELSSGKQIAVGSLADFPELAIALSPEEQKMASENGLVKILPEFQVLWLCGKNKSRIRQVANDFFAFTDQYFRKPNKP